MGTVSKPIVLDETVKETNNILNKMLTCMVNNNSTEIENWKDVQAIVQKGFGEQYFPVGTEFDLYVDDGSKTKTNYKVVVLDHNKNFLIRNGKNTAKYSMTLGFKNVLSGNIVFKGAENEYGLTKDTNIVSWKTYYILSGSEYKKVEAPNVAEITQYYEKNDSKRVAMGGNNWATSFARQWLNSPASSGEKWFSQQTAFDKEPTQSDIGGFINQVYDDSTGENVTFREVVRPVTVQSMLPTVLNPDNSLYYLDCDANGEYAVSLRQDYIQTEDKFFLPSVGEVYAMTNCGDEAFEFYRSYSDFKEPSTQPDTNRIKTFGGNSTTKKYYYLRENRTQRASTTNKYSLNNVQTSGTVWVGQPSSTDPKFAPCFVIY